MSRSMSSLKRRKLDYSDFYNSSSADASAGIVTIRSKKVKKLNASSITKNALVDLLMPRWRLSGVMVKPTFWNDKLPSNNLIDGSGTALGPGKREFTGGKDWVQFLFNPVEQFLCGVKRASVAPQNYLRDRTQVNDDGVFYNNSGAVLNSDSNPNPGYIANFEAYMSDNLKGSMEYYEAEHTITSTCATTIELILYEVQPKSLIRTAPIIHIPSSVGTTASVNAVSYSNALGWVNVSVPVTVAADAVVTDPLSCIVTDLIDRNDKDGQANNSNSRLSTNVVAPINTAGLLLNDMSYDLNRAYKPTFNKYYKVIRKTKILLHSGETYKYKLSIPAYVSSAKAYRKDEGSFGIQFANSIYTNAVPAAVNVTSTNYKFRQVPFVDRHSRFLVIEGVPQKLVTSDQNDSSLGFATGSYVVTQKINCGYRFMPQDYLQNTTVRADGDFTVDPVDNSAVVLDSILPNVQQQMTTGTNIFNNQDQQTVR